MISRAERTPFSEWWWTIDKPLLFSLAALMVGGIVLSLAASPAVADRLNLDLFHFVNRQVMFLIPTVLLTLGISFLDPRKVRRLALGAYLIFFPLMIFALFFGPEIKGAHRWIQIGPLGVQPSEFVKPSFIVLAAWLFAEGTRRDDVPGHLLAMTLFGATIGVLILQPDFGQTMLIGVVWGCLFFLAGLRWIWMIGLGGLGVGGVFLAYEALPHVRARFGKFLNPETGENFQTERAFESFVSGGWFGKGPGEGTVKRILPDAHTDFIFAVTGEEFGIIFCLILLSLFAFVVLRGLWHALNEDEPFVRLAIAGLTMLFGLQSAINMAVNVQLMPAKGMTLPFISYGGSSLISLALGMGMLLALTRRRPRARLVEGFPGAVPAGQFS
ncbi:putative lipid II flippase FtsW [Flaviflagellibacter deserti]|jgi:cell division protein FtsW|uniref:Probable peptidoglycan glycosyltransferase FtsW n=1 Tax=Flaviflagellibacter deserti TaxID=2267266 RepID=A0ABV9Z6B7_9HYPH